MPPISDDVARKVGTGTAAATPQPAPSQEKAIKEFQDDLTKRAATYQKIVIAGGYAAFFTVWSGTKSLLPPFQTLLSAMCMSISLAVYIAFEVFQTNAMNQAALEIGRAETTQKAVAVIQAQTARDNKAFRFWTTWLWHPVWMFALVAVFILMYAFVVRILHQAGYALGWI